MTMGLGSWDADENLLTVPTAPNTRIWRHTHFQWSNLWSWFFSADAIANMKLIKLPGYWGTNFNLDAINSPFYELSMFVFVLGRYRHDIFQVRRRRFAKSTAVDEPQHGLCKCNTNVTNR